MIGKKSEISKKDMNFFSEFSSSGAQIATLLTISLISIVIIFILALGFLSIVVIQTRSLNSDIEKIREELDDSDNLKKLDEFERLSFTIEDRREYLFVLSDLKNQIDSNYFVKSEDLSALSSNIPSDVVLTYINYEDGSIRFGGTCESYDSALNMAAALKQEDVFTYIHITQILYNDDYKSYDEEIADLLWHYNFSFVGTLLESYQVTMTRYTDASPQVLISSPIIRDFPAGESYSFSEIVTFSSDGTDYVLNRIIINDATLSSEQFEIMLMDNAVKGIVLEHTDIRLMYVEANNVEGGEAQ